MEILTYIAIPINMKDVNYNAIAQVKDMSALCWFWKSDCIHWRGTEIP